METLGNAVACVYMKLPFCGQYAGQRMQAWVMLCFGESVVGLLIQPIYYSSEELGALIAVNTSNYFHDPTDPTNRRNRIIQPFPHPNMIMRRLSHPLYSSAHSTHHLDNI